MGVLEEGASGGCHPAGPQPQGLECCALWWAWSLLTHSRLERETPRLPEVMGPDHSLSGLPSLLGCLPCCHQYPLEPLSKHPDSGTPALRSSSLTFISRESFSFLMCLTQRGGPEALCSAAPYGAPDPQWTCPLYTSTAFSLDLNQ